MSFELYKGEIVGIAGLDGQGQDEFVRILAGVQNAAQGVVHAIDRAGKSQPIQSLADAVALHIAYVSGDRKREGIFDALSIFENLVMPLYRDKKRGGKLGLIDWRSLKTIFSREAENLLLKFGLQEDKITSLSGGNQQKVLIGRGFAMRPDIIVLNDPARGIDVGAKSELYKHLRTFAESGKSVVYMSSELEEFIGFASRVIVFRDGAPFDAFSGAGVEPKAILNAMFGQTDRSGLAKHPADVVIQAHIGAEADKSAIPKPASPLEPKNATAPSTEIKVHVSPTSDPPKKPDIKIVEFDDRTGNARRLG